MKSVPTFTETREKLPENVEGTTLPEQSQSLQILSEAPLAQTHRRNPCWPEACLSQLPLHAFLRCCSSLLSLSGLSPLHSAFSGQTFVLSNVNTSSSLLQQHEVLLPRDCIIKPQGPRQQNSFSSERQKAVRAGTTEH